MNAKELLKKLNACLEAVVYVGNQSALDAWNNCERGDWMLWIAKKQGVDLKVLTLAKVRCARLVEHLMEDDRSIAALVAAERFANGEITRKELDAAYVAACAAADAGYAAAAADAYDASYAAAYVAACAASYAAYAADDAAYAACAAYDAGYASYAAAYAGYAAADDAKKETLLKCANICRESIPFNLLNIQEST